MKAPAEGTLRGIATFLATFGIGVATYIAIADSGGGSPVCVAGGHGCQTVAESSYSHVLGVNIAIFGIVGYVLLLACALLRGMGKKFVLVNDAPGFVSNRVMMLMVNEAILLLKEGVASAEDVDAIFRSCMGHTMGPLETADLIGLDTILHTLEILDDSFGGDKFRPCTLLRDMVERGEYGRKTGRGFYTYARPAK